MNSLADENDSNGDDVLPRILGWIIKQFTLQVLEPICEAKIQKDSYGFIPNRSTIMPMRDY